MRDVKISEANFRRIQQLAEPIVDSVDSVIQRLLDAYEAGAPDPGPISSRRVSYSEFNPFAPPPLTHTRVIRAQINGLDVQHPNWNSVVVEVLNAASPHREDLKFVAGIGDMNSVAGRRTDSGYRYYPGLDLSIQGQDANGACRSAFKLAKHFEVTLNIWFEWRNRPDAAFPGIASVLEFDPATFNPNRW